MKRNTNHVAESVAIILVVSLLLSLGLLLFEKPALGARPSLRERVIAVALAEENRCPNCGEYVPPEAFADAIVPLTNNPVSLAQMISIAVNESHLSARIARGDCLLKKHECDDGRAWGLWQVHKLDGNAAEWGSPDVAVQARAAFRLMLSQRRRCAKFEQPIATFRAYTGRGCDQPFPRDQERVDVYNRVIGRL